MHVQPSSMLWLYFARALAWKSIISLNFPASVAAKNMHSCIRHPQFRKRNALIVCLIQAHTHLSIPSIHIVVFDHGELQKLWAGGHGKHVFCLQMWCCACKLCVCEFDCNVVDVSKPWAGHESSPPPTLNEKLSKNNTKLTQKEQLNPTASQQTGSLPPLQTSEWHFYPLSHT